MRHNRIYSPVAQVTRKYAILSAFILAACSVFGQSESTFIRRLPKDTTITTPFSNMVLMSLPVFTEYYFAKTNYERLADLIPVYQRMADSVDRLHRLQLVDMDSAMQVSGSIIALERTSKEEAVAEVIRLTNRLNREARKNKLLKVALIGTITYAVFK